MYLRINLNQEFDLEKSEKFNKRSGKSQEKSENCSKIDLWQP